MKATNIMWDIDHDDNGILPTEIEIPKGMTDEEEISNYISNVTDYCHCGFALED